MCVFVCVRERECVCVCVCKKEKVCVCVCVCERESVCVCEVCERESVCWWVGGGERGWGICGWVSPSPPPATCHRNKKRRLIS